MALSILMYFWYQQNTAGCEPCVELASNLGADVISGTQR